MTVIEWLLLWAMGVAFLWKGIMGLLIRQPGLQILSLCCDDIYNLDFSLVMAQHFRDLGYTHEAAVSENSEWCPWSLSWAITSWLKSPWLLNHGCFRTSQLFSVFLSLTESSYSSSPLSWYFRPQISALCELIYFLVLSLYQFVYKNVYKFQEKCPFISIIKLCFLVLLEMWIWWQRSKTCSRRKFKRILLKSLNWSRTFKKSSSWWLLFITYKLQIMWTSSWNFVLTCRTEIFVFLLF